MLCELCVDADEVRDKSFRNIGPGGRGEGKRGSGIGL